MITSNTAYVIRLHTALQHIHPPVIGPVTDTSDINEMYGMDTERKLSANLLSVSGQISSKQSVSSLFIHEYVR